MIMYEDGQLQNIVEMGIILVLVIVVIVFIVRKIIENKSDFMKEEKKLKSYLEKMYNGEYVSLRDREEIYNKLKLNVYLMKNIIDEWNKNHIKRELNVNDKLLSNIDGKSLNKNQREIVIIDDDILVMAGAGSGKTLTIAAKVKYLVDVKGVDPKEILILSLSNEATNELSEKIRHKLNVLISVTTFHKLGHKILNSSNNNYNIDFKGKILKSSINDYFEMEINEGKYSDVLIRRVIDFVSWYMHEPEEDFENDVVQFKTLKAECVNENKRNIHGEYVKSFYELQIANFLFLHGIKYEYEKKYNYIDDNYYPSFYLPDYDIYLEHFGIDKNGNVPKYWKVSSEQYKESIKWKREVHKKYGTTMLESYSYWRDDLIDNLKSLLVENGIECKRDKNDDKIYNYICNNLNFYMPVLKHMVMNFIELYKINNFNKEDIDIISNSSGIKTKEFLMIAVPILNFYVDNLIKENMIDINDIINESIALVNNNKVELKYKYIFLDEFQDITKSNFELYSAIKKQTKAKIMCVGDDWQSIYNHAGSNLNYIINFEKYNGPNKLFKLEKNYRNPQGLIEDAGKFILKNKKLLKKNLWSSLKIDKPIVILKYESSNLDAIEVALKEIEKIEGNEKKINIMVLGRYEYNKKFLTIPKQIKSVKFTEVSYYHKMYPNYKIEYSTMHLAKGLESDYVILLDMNNNLYGMPSKIKSDQVINDLSNYIGLQEDYAYAEERRLFYVALTRTKRKVFLAVHRNKPSLFIDEFDSENVCFIDIPKKSDSNRRCIKCGGIMAQVKDYEFMSCENYPQCNYME